MSLIGKLRSRFSRKDPSGVRFRREAAERIAGHRIRYVTERREGVDRCLGVVGAEGFLEVAQGRLAHLLRIVKVGLVVVVAGPGRK